jgi:hypothetical protein
MTSARRVALAALLLGAVLGRAWPLEVSQDRLKLVLYEGIGRFCLYLDGVPLLADQDPRTSGISLLLDNRLVKLGESGEFRETAEALPGGARFSWRSKRVLVSASFAFQGSSGLVLTVAVTNQAQRSLEAGVRLLLDTYLGEAGFPHFRTDRAAEINNEVVFDRKSMPEYWVSRSSRAAGSPGLQVYLRGEGITTPDRLVMANWKRLTEAGWSYESSPARSFSELPYSINDSAIGQYYDPVALPPGGSRTVVVLFAASSEQPEETPLVPEPSLIGEPAPEATAAAGSAAVPEGVEGVGGAAEAQAPSAGPAEGAAEAAAAGTPQAPPAGQQALSIQGDLRVVDGLLQQLDRKLGSGAPLSEDELRLMEQMLSDLKNRLERYGE